MFVLQKKILFARGLNWDQSCLWKTPPSHFLLLFPLACPYFLKKISSPDFWGVKEAPCKNLYVFDENSQRNQFPKLTTFLLHFSLMSPLCHSAMTHLTFLKSRDTLIMTLRVSDWYSESDLDSIRNSSDVYASYICYQLFWHATVYLE